MEYLERTEVAGNSITTKQENKMETQQSNEVSIKIPVNQLIDSLAESNIITNLISDAVAENTENSVDEYFSEKGSELLDRYDIMTSDNIDEHIASYLSDNFDEYLDQSDIVNDVISRIDDRDLVNDGIENNLDQYSPQSSCGMAKKAYEAIIDSVRYDLMCHGINESTRESHYVHGEGLTIFNQLKRIIEEIVDDRLQKVELVKTFDKTTKVEIVDDLVPSTAFPCTHFKITTYTPEQSEAIKAFLFSNKQMRESRVQFTTKTNTQDNPL
jgi:hypothetical protein